ncbi:hypothetical protein L1987_20897 [Smallanthus sonchifolius]|uniref:Uncharacterized protein n=1 Tax=Smallanthus sonchifolius TaxID=185202 RepID=A0ACB9ISD4_9ASTR|nr:hypothetical protein L1987_20897 [Smallanthus sonchifolius]
MGGTELMASTGCLVESRVLPGHGMGRLCVGADPEDVAEPRADSEVIVESAEEAELRVEEEPPNGPKMLYSDGEGDTDESEKVDLMKGKTVCRVQVTKSGMTI